MGNREDSAAGPSQRAYLAESNAETIDSVLNVASSPARAKNGEAPGTHCLRMRLISPRCGDSGLFSDSSVSCDVRVRTRYSKLVRIMACTCNESSDFQQTPFSDGSLNFQLSACTSHT